MNKYLDERSNEELYIVEGGSVLGSIWTGVKVAGAVAGTGAAGLAVGAGAIMVTYYGCKWLFG